MTKRWDDGASQIVFAWAQASVSVSDKEVNVAIAARIKQLVSGSPRRAFDPSEYWEERHRVFHDSHKAVGHTGISAEANAEQYELKLRLILDAIERHSGSRRGKTLLDAGCGIGLLTRRFVEAGFSVVGADFCATAIERAVSEGIDAEFVVSPLATLELGRRFDVVVAIDVLLHVVDEEVWTQTLSALARHLSEDGLLVIVDWLDDGATELGDHVHPRSIRQYASALKALSCSIIQQDQFHLEHENATKDLLVARRGACSTR